MAQVTEPRPVHRSAAWPVDLADRALRTAIADGRLPVGARLPATRNLAAELDVSRGVVVEAYQRLVDEGILAGRRGGGTAVRTAAPQRRPVRSNTVAPTAVEFDLSPGLPDLSAFPRATWLRAERTVLAGLGATDLGYGDPRGMPALRDALAGWLNRTRGIRVDPQDLLVVNGVAQGLALLAQVLRVRGTRTIGFEEPGPQGTRRQLQRWGLSTVPVPVDDLGLNDDALAATGLDTVVVTPAHQFPTGVVLAAPRRRWSYITSPALGQLVLAQLITSGALDRHLRLTRTRYRRRRNAVPLRRLHEPNTG